jgi:hypothetical protein
MKHLVTAYFLITAIIMGWMGCSVLFCDFHPHKQPTVEEKAAHALLQNQIEAGYKAGLLLCSVAAIHCAAGVLFLARRRLNSFAREVIELPFSESWLSFLKIFVPALIISGVLWVVLFMLLALL